MKLLVLLLSFLTILSCAKTKTVYICGDHACINKAEAEQYFEDNLSLEVMIVNNNKKKEIDLVELNLNSDIKEKKSISLLRIKKPNSDIKILSKKEIAKKQIQIKERKKNKDKKSKDIKNVKKGKSKNSKKVIDNTVYKKISVNKANKEIVDICTLLKECSIDEISKYLIDQGNKKKFPDITRRE